jgi:hypothetical protein
VSGKNIGAIATLAGAAVGLAMLVSSCGFTITFAPLPFCLRFDEIGFTEVEGDPPAVVFEQPGAVQVLHGIGRATRTSGHQIKVEQSAEIPAYANRATVFLNGWRAAYDDGDDHHVAGLGTMIARLNVQPGKLTWNALGGIGDDSEDARPFTWSYAYTIVAWNDTAVQAMVDHSDDEFYCKEPGGSDGADNFYYASNENTTTALASFRSFLENPGFATGRQVAVMPRGYGYVWDHGDDHHLLQVAYNLEGASPYVEHLDYQKANATLNPLAANPSTGRAGGAFVSWNTEAIFKDNSGRRDFIFAEIVSAMGGPDVELIQPPFSILPIEDDSSGSVGGAGVATREFVVENLPYLCAVPMLTGWNLGYLTSDQHVKEIGIWLSDVRYERPAGAATGTLRYKLNSVMRDNDDMPDHFSAHTVSVLGLKRDGGVKRDASGRPID